MLLMEYPVDQIKRVLFIVLVILSLILTVQVITQVKISSDEVMVQSILRKISDTLEDFKKKQGYYPPNLSSVILREYPYRLDYYFTSPINGYKLQSSISKHTYDITASPVSGPSEKIFHIRTGGEITEEFVNQD